MLKLLGAVLVILGSTGFGLAYREDLRQTLYNTRSLAMILELMKSEIAYSKATLPEACRMAGEKMEDPFKSYLLGICEIMRTNKGLPFDKVWKQEMGKCMKSLLLGEGDKELFLQFSDSTGYADNRMQLLALEKYSDLFAQSVKKQEESMENKARVVMSMGLTGGIFLTIVLL